MPKNKKLSRRQLLLGSSGILASSIATFCYMRHFEPYWLTLSYKKIVLPKAANQLRILHLSDLHASHAVPLSFIESAFKIGIEQHPDLICITGDFITNRFNDINLYSRSLRQLSVTAPTVASPGNHDGGKWAAARGGHSDISQLRNLLVSSEITLLENSSEIFDMEGWKIQLVGLTDLWSGPFDPIPAFENKKPEADYTIVLSHNPDTKEELRDFDFDLMLCGHTHGGQLRIPFYGAPFAPVKDPLYIEGLLPWEERLIHITRGVGNVGGLRLNCPPEVSIIDIISADSPAATAFSILEEEYPILPKYG